MINKEFKSAILISLALHVVIIIVLLFGSMFSHEAKKPSTKMMEAVVIDPKAIEQQAQSIRQKRDADKKAEQKKREDLRKKQQQLENVRKKEEDRLRREKEQKIAAEKAQREAQRKAQQDAERKEAERKAQLQRQAEAKREAERVAAAKKAADAKAAAEAAAAKKAAEAKALAEKKAAEKKAAELKAKQEAERKAKAEAERKAKIAAEKAAAEKARLAREKAEQEAALSDIFSGLEAETEQISVARQRQIASELDRYGAIYTQMIQEKLLIDDSFKGKTCQINIRLVSTGKDAMVSRVSSVSGDNSVCAAAKRAVTQVGTFPLPSDKDVADKLKNINLTVEPQ